jgi:signal transduction histidine kinase
VHRIVTDAKGTIHVTSRVGEGTSMRVVLPAAQGQAPAERESELAGVAS